jgi:DNA polymerase III delta subunit
MIYFFSGTDTKKSFEKAFSLFQSLKQKKPEASFLSFDEENISVSILDELIGSQGLFEKKLVAFLKYPLERADINKEILKRIKNLRESENIFVWLEKDATPTEEKTIAEASEKHLISKDTEKAKDDFNVFSLTETFGKRDKLKLWTLLLEAFKKGKSAEEIQGVIFWQAKTVAISKSEKTAESAGLKPFAYSKAKQFGNNFSDEEISNYLKRLVEIYHEAHLGRLNFEMALEEFVLSL